MSILDDPNFVSHTFFRDGVAKRTVIPAGLVLAQHAHKYEHLSILASGRARVVCGDDSRVIEGPADLVIPADKVHAVHAVTDCVWYCIHATDETDAKKVDGVLISERPHSDELRAVVKQAQEAAYFEV